MAEFLITKREKCERYEYYGAGHANCKTCDGTGYIDTPVNILDVLAKVRWVATDGGPLGFMPSQQQFKNLTIED